MDGGAESVLQERGGRRASHPPAQLSLGLASLISAYRGGSLRPETVISAVYDRIEAHADDAVWTYLVPREAAVKRARDLSSSRAPGGGGGDELPPLFGVPFTVKDNMDVAGLQTTAACPAFSYTAESTATVVQRMLDSGAVLIGKTNMDQLATGLTGHRSPHGSPRCVLDARYIAGGSSSGAAVSVGAGFASFALGTDTAGSIRVPAALNGLVGLKPTFGSVSAAGVVPACRTVDCVGIIARTVEDAVIPWALARGYDDRDPFSRSVLPAWPSWPSKPRFSIPPPANLRVLRRDFDSSFSRAVDVLRHRVGLELVDVDYAPFQAANDLLYGSSIVAQRLEAFDSQIREHGLAHLHPVVRTVFESASGFTAVQAYGDMHKVQLYRRRAEIEFRNFDVLVVPTIPDHFTFEQVDEDPLGTNRTLGEFTQFVNPLDLCALAVPAGRWVNSDGASMAFGVTLVAQACREEELARVGKALMDSYPDCTGGQQT